MTGRVHRARISAGAAAAVILRGVDMVRFGRGIRALRQRRRWTQDELAVEVGVSRAQIVRVETGRSQRLAVHLLERMAQALGARVHIRLDWNGETLDRLLDAGHAAIVEAVVRELRSLGWEIEIEATYAIYGERGSIDVLAWHAQNRVLLVVEVKSVVPDVQATLAGVDRKARLAWKMAAQRGWRPRAVARLLVVGEAPTARRRVRAHAATFETELPDRNVAVRRYLASPSAERPLRGLWFLSVGRVRVVRTRVARVRSAS